MILGYLDDIRTATAVAIGHALIESERHKCLESIVRTLDELREDVAAITIDDSKAVKR